LAILPREGVTKRPMNHEKIREWFSEIMRNDEFYYYYYYYYYYSFADAFKKGGLRGHFEVHSQMRLK
jgi:hypothetical protein